MERRPISLWMALMVAICISFVGESIAQQCSRKADIVFLFDQSGSITDRNPRNGSWDNWVLIKQFAGRLVMNFNISYSGTHIGAVTFGNIAVKRFGLTTYLDANSVVNAINSIPPGQGETNLYAGLYTACTDVFSPANGARSQVSKILIVITDGFANLNTDQTIPQAQSCRNQGITIFTIGMTDLVDMNQLRSVSSPPQIQGENWWATPDYTTLNNVLQSVQNNTCNPPKIAMGDMCNVLDIAFAVDIPNDQTSWGYLKSFMLQFITLYLTVGSNAVRVAFVTYSSNGAVVRFNLTTYNNEDDVKQAIDMLPYTASSSADPTFAFNALAQYVFQNGNRTGGQSVAVLLTDNAFPNLNNAIAASKRLQNLGIEVIVFDMISANSLSNLRSVASNLQDVISSADYIFLSSKQTQLAQVICSNNPGPQCPMTADIVLLMDESTSIVVGGMQNWNTYALGFAVSLAQAFPISRNETQLGVIKFSNYYTPVIYLNDTNNVEDLTNRIKNIPINGGETNIADGIRASRDIMFSAARGARPNVPHILILGQFLRPNSPPPRFLRHRRGGDRFLIS